MMLPWMLASGLAAGVLVETSLTTPKQHNVHRRCDLFSGTSHATDHTGYDKQVDESGHSSDPSHTELQVIDLWLAHELESAATDGTACLSVACQGLLTIPCISIGNTPVSFPDISVLANPTSYH